MKFPTYGRPYASGILSDTLIFKSPTCTPEDKRLAEHLAEIAGVNIQKYGIRMLSKGESLEGIPPRTIITRDMKKFIMGNYKVSVSQVNVGDIEAYKEILGHMKAELESVCNDNNLIFPSYAHQPGNGRYGTDSSR